ncbi:8395_t:CDS:2, partial [Scutellospora calospora]
SCQSCGSSVLGKKQQKKKPVKEKKATPNKNRDKKIKKKIPVKKTAENIVKFKKIEMSKCPEDCKYLCCRQIIVDKRLTCNLGSCKNDKDLQRSRKCGFQHDGFTY